ncbi:Immune inhibitor A OS=Streptomyces griseomycini OX=66895 GN=FHS37_005203 PE=4 SV=1 [Streptomyces griseomycini]
MTSRPWTFRAAAIGVALAAVTATCSAFTVAQADTADKADRPGTVDRHDPAEHNHVEHDLEGPLSKTQEAQREEALKQVISGKAEVKEKNGSKVVQLKSRKGDAKYVELGREKTDKIFTILVEFGDQIDSRYGGTPGPLHNQIDKPDRKKNNSTAWQADFDQDHFQDLYFGDGKGVATLKTYYEKQSSGRYSVDGEVSDWVKVPYNEARYGNNDCRDTNCPSVWYAVQRRRERLGRAA